VTDATTDDVVSIVRRGEAEIGVGPERTVGDDVTQFVPDGRADPSWSAPRSTRWRADAASPGMSCATSDG
jgi:hypothetical protein